MTPITNKEISERIKKLRHLKGLTMKEVAATLGVPLSTYKEWEYGRSIRDVSVYPRLAEVLGTPLVELLGGVKPSLGPVIEETERLEHHLGRLLKELRALS